MSERHVEFEACFNFRDVGGYDTVDGRRVRTGLVFRSDELQRFSARDLEVAEELGIRTVIDLRSTDELTRDGRFARAEEVAFHHLPIFEQDALPFVAAQPGAPAPPPGDDYVSMATSGSEVIATTLDVIADAEYAAVFHCAAGKDRTGVVAALLLSILGVPEELIVADYHLSDHTGALWLEWADTNAPELAAEMRALPPWLHRAPMPVMQAFLDQLADRHGSIEQYLLDAGVSRDAMDTLRARLLQTA